MLRLDRGTTNPQRLSHGPKELPSWPTSVSRPRLFPRPQVRLTPRWGSRYDGTPICLQPLLPGRSAAHRGEHRQICRVPCGGRGSSEQRKRAAEATLALAGEAMPDRRFPPPWTVEANVTPAASLRPCARCSCAVRNQTPQIIYQSELIYTDDLTPSFQLASGVRRLEALKDACDAS